MVNLLFSSPFIIQEKCQEKVKALRIEESSIYKLRLQVLNYWISVESFYTHTGRALKVSITAILYRCREIIHL